MGGEKQQSSGTQVYNSTTTPTPTAEETAMNQLTLQRMQAAQPGQLQAQQSGLNLVNLLLTGTEPLPGFFQNLSQGLDKNAIADITGEAMRTTEPSFQKSGLMDSGTRASVMGRMAGDIGRGAYEYNLSNKYNLLNLALTGQASVQQPLLSQQAMLGSQLAGLRSNTTSGVSNYNGMSSTGTNWMNMAGMGLAGAGMLASGGLGAGVGAGAGMLGGAVKGNFVPSVFGY